MAAISSVVGPTIFDNDTDFRKMVNHSRFFLHNLSTGSVVQL